MVYTCCKGAEICCTCVHSLFIDPQCIYNTNTHTLYMYITLNSVIYSVYVHLDCCHTHCLTSNMQYHLKAIHSTKLHYKPARSTLVDIRTFSADKERKLSQRFNQLYIHRASVLHSVCLRVIHTYTDSMEISDVC